VAPLELRAVSLSLSIEKKKKNSQKPSPPLFLFFFFIQTAVSASVTGLNFAPNLLSFLPTGFAGAIQGLNIAPQLLWVGELYLQERNDDEDEGETDHHPPSFLTPFRLSFFIYFSAGPIGAQVNPQGP
jgi:hypothetical protein